MSVKEVSGRAVARQNTVDTLQYGFSTGKNLTRRTIENQPETEDFIRGVYLAGIKNIHPDVYEQLKNKYGSLDKYVSGGAFRVVE